MKKCYALNAMLLGLIAGNLQAAPAVPVLVTNPVTKVTVANPVTTVTVANSVSTVTVANPVNSVTINNTEPILVTTVSSAPILMRDADHPARHHFQKACLNSLTAPGQLECTFSLPYNIHQLHVIETVTASISMASGAKPATMAIETTSDSLTAEHQLVPIASRQG